jgi:branched-subunit amino acid aminotransferase/4-amino-4-deoxychorismate lyase
MYFTLRFCKSRFHFPARMTSAVARDPALVMTWTPSGTQPVDDTGAFVTPQRFLEAFPAGAYTTMRTVGVRRVLFFPTHADRLSETLRELDFKAAQLDTTLLAAYREQGGCKVPLQALSKSCIQTFIERYPALYSGHNNQFNDTWTGPELKLTVLIYAEGSKLHWLCHATLLHEVISPDGVQVEVAGHPREHAHAKNSQWVRDRHTQITKRYPDETHELVLHDDQGRLYEGTSCNFFVVDMNNEIRTAPLTHVLPGTIQLMLAKVCERESIPLRYAFPELQEYQDWKAAFLTSTSRIVVPIRRLIWSDAVTGDEQQKDLQPDYPIVLRLQSLMHDQLRQDATDVFSGSY